MTEYDKGLHSDLCDMANRAGGWATNLEVRLSQPWTYFDPLKGLMQIEALRGFASECRDFAVEVFNRR